MKALELLPDRFGVGILIAACREGRRDVRRGAAAAGRIELAEMIRLRLGRGRPQQMPRRMPESLALPAILDRGSLVRTIGLEPLGRLLAPGS